MLLALYLLLNLFTDFLPSFLPVKSICYPHVSRSFPNLSSWLCLRQSILTLCSWHQVKQTNTHLVILYICMRMWAWQEPWENQRWELEQSTIRVVSCCDWRVCPRWHEGWGWMFESSCDSESSPVLQELVVIQPNADESAPHSGKIGNVLLGYWGAPWDRLLGRVGRVTIHPQTRWLQTTVIHVSCECGFALDWLS